MLKLMRDPLVQVLAFPLLNSQGFLQFLDHNYGKQAAFELPTETDGDFLPEIAGRICYMSFKNPRPGGNKAYLEHIKECGHGSVLEHSNWSFILEGISRSLSHELVRHRAGMAYSQLSQRYVDESEVAFVVPPALHPYMKAWEEKMDHRSWSIFDNWYRARQQNLQEYKDLVDVLSQDAPKELKGTERRKWARQAARSVLPNCTETKLVMTANARALRHCIEMRASAAADVEIRKLFITILKLLQEEAPNLFGDYTIMQLPDGTEAAETPWRKV